MCVSVAVDVDVELRRGASGVGPLILLVDIPPPLAPTPGFLLTLATREASAATLLVLATGSAKLEYGENACEARGSAGDDMEACRKDGVSNPRECVASACWPARRVPSLPFFSFSFCFFFSSLSLSLSLFRSSSSPSPSRDPELEGAGAPRRKDTRDSIPDLGLSLSRSFSSLLDSRSLPFPLPSALTVPMSSASCCFVELTRDLDVVARNVCSKLERRRLNVLGRSRSRSGEPGGDGMLPGGGAAPVTAPECEPMWTGASTAAAAIGVRNAQTALERQRVLERGCEA